MDGPSPSAGNTDTGRDGRLKVDIGLIVVRAVCVEDKVGPVDELRVVGEAWGETGGSTGAVGGVMIGVDSSQAGGPAKSGGLLYFSTSTVPPKSRTRKTWMTVEKVNDWTLVTHRRAAAWLVGFSGGMLVCIACVRGLPPAPCRRGWMLGFAI